MDIYGTAGDDQLEHLYPPGIHIWISVWGGAGNDTIRVAYSTAVGEAGNDTIIGVPEARAPGSWEFPSAAYWNSPAAVDINLVTGIVQDGFGTTDTLANITWVKDSQHSDRITGSARDEHFAISWGNDTVIGGGGNDRATMSNMRADEVSTHYDIASSVFTMTKHTWAGDTGTSILTGISQIDFTGSTIGHYTVTATGAADGGKRIVADLGTDIVVSGAGNDIIEAGDGIDTVIFSANRATYTVTKTESGFTVSGADGSDTLVGVERLAFRDQNIAYDITGVAGQAYRLYDAVFDRTPDAAGMGFWIAMLDQGVSLTAVAQGFINSDEFKDLYGAPATYTGIVTKLYTNIFNRPDDTAGISFWAGALDAGHADLADLVRGLSLAEGNTIDLVGVTANGVSFTPWG